MLFCMRHLEIHVIYSEADAAHAGLAGLIDLVNDESCDHCGEDVAFTASDFVPCTIVLEDDEEWLLCTDCALPTIDPGLD
jgi:hypothetical protein